MTNTGIFSPKDINDLTAYEQWVGMIGQLELIETQTFSAVNDVQFLDIKEQVYEVHFAILHNITSTGGNESIGCQVYEQGTLESGSVYNAGYQNLGADGSYSESKFTNGARWFCTKFGDNGTKTSYNYFYQLGDAAKFSLQTMHSVINHNGVIEGRFGGGNLDQRSRVTGLRFFPTVSATNTMTGTISLYGIRFS